MTLCSRDPAGRNVAEFPAASAAASLAPLRLGPAGESAQETFSSFAFVGGDLDCCQGGG